MDGHRPARPDLRPLSACTVASVCLYYNLLCMAASAGLHAAEIRSRPPRTWWQTLHGVAFLLVFLFGCVMINGSQIVFLAPLKLLPFAWAGKVYYEGIRYSKAAFGTLLSMSSDTAVLRFRDSCSCDSPGEPVVCAHQAGGDI